MERRWMCVWACLLAVALALPALAQDATIADLHKVMADASAQGDVAAAQLQAHRIIGLAAGKPVAELTPDEQYAVGLAHLQVAAEVLDIAAQSGKLSAEQLAAIEKLRATGLVATAPAKPAQEPLIVVAHGEQIRLEDYLVAGKTTIVDFYSDFCPPCRALTPRLEALVKARPDLNVVKVDINRPGHQGIDWGSPVAQQFELHSIPQLRLYGPDGQLQLQGDDAFEQVLKWCDAR